LIEVLVVVAIIMILISLTSAAVFKALGRGNQVQARSEIALLESALALCRSDLGLDVIPSFLVLREDGQYQLAGPYQAQYPKTIALLQKMFGRHFKVGSPHDWNGNGIIDQGELVLEGPHCLVFFLGGIPTPPGGTDGCTGFSANRANPTALGGTRLGPYFEFKSNRLRRETSGLARDFLVYLDVWEAQPYAYFSATKAGNDYTADCPSLGIRPYFDLSRRFLNPNGCQILCAGPDRQFGPGGLWNPAKGYTSGPGVDDLSNFSATPLGIAE
jgi:hypothetical protein